MSESISHDSNEWQRRVLSIRSQIESERELTAKRAAEKTSSWDDDARMRQLYCELECLRMDFSELPEVASVLRKRELAGRQPAGPQSTPVSESSKSEADHPDPEHHQVESEQPEELQHAEDAVHDAERRKSISEEPQQVVPDADVDKIVKLFDDARALCNLQRKKPKSSLLQAVRLLASVVYFLVWAPVFFILSPLRLLHPTLRNIGIQNNFLPIDLLQMWFSRGFLSLFGVSVYVEGDENIDLNHNVVAMFSHGSNLDPMVVAAGPLAFKWIGKKILFRIPIMGWLFNLYGHIGIDRGNKEKAIASLDEAVQRIHKWGRSIAISPEGTRSKSGRLLDFKKGPFHLTTQVNLPILPICILGAAELWPSGQLFVESGGDITVRFLPRMTIQPTDDYNTLASRVRREMLKGISAPRDPPQPTDSSPAVGSDKAKSEGSKFRKPYVTPWGKFFGNYFVVLFYFGLWLMYLYIRSISRR